MFFFQVLHDRGVQRNPSARLAELRAWALERVISWSVFLLERLNMQ